MSRIDSCNSSARLLELCADANATDKGGGTPLFYALSSHADELERRGIPMLLEADASSSLERQRGEGTYDRCPSIVHQVLPLSSDYHMLRADAPEFHPEGLNCDRIILSTTPDMLTTALGPAEIIPADADAILRCRSQVDTYACDAWYTEDIRLPDQRSLEIRRVSQRYEDAETCAQGTDWIAARRLICKAVSRALILSAGGSPQGLRAQDCLDWISALQPESRLQLAAFDFCPASQHCFALGLCAEPFWSAECHIPMIDLADDDDVGTCMYTPPAAFPVAASLCAPGLQTTPVFESYAVKMWYDQEEEPCEPDPLDTCRLHEGCRRCMGCYRLEVDEVAQELLVVHGSDLRPR